MTEKYGHELRRDSDSDSDNGCAGEDQQFNRNLQPVYLLLEISSCFSKQNQSTGLCHEDAIISLR